MAWPVIFLGLFFSVSYGKALKSEPNYYYELKIYHFKTDLQEKSLDKFLEQAYLPALHKAGIKIAGVFKSKVIDTADKLIYVLIPLQKIDQFFSLDRILEKDIIYQSNGKDYLQAAYNSSFYNRIEIILLNAFDGMPEPMVPKLMGRKADRIYELRSYESPTENLGVNKIGMFNSAEISMFEKLDFNAVFYGKVIIGSHMPNLMYLTTFNNKEDRDKHWEAFGTEYKKISGLPQYQNNVNKYIIAFLYPTAYSDI